MSAATVGPLHRPSIVWSVIVLASAVSVALSATGGTPPSTGQRTAATPTRVLFLCPHGAAKSVLASAYFQKLAKERGLNVRVDAAGTEPDATVSPAVADHLQRQGYSMPIDKPRAVTSGDLTGTDVVISLGCDVKALPGESSRVRRWDDVPGPGEDLAGADDAIRRHVAELVDELVRRSREP